MHPLDPPRRTTRRSVLKALGTLGAGATLGHPALTALAATAGRVTLPFDNGERELVVFPQKRPLILQTSRPPQLETPFAVFNEGVITPNDAFFVRYHWSGIPTSIDPATYRLQVSGNVDTPLDLSLGELKALGEAREIVAINQCSGNGRGHFQPRIGGGQLSNGAMGNARWTGVPLRQVLDKAGVRAGSVQVVFDGLDHPPLADAKSPDFIKALDIDHARDGEVMIAWAMNGADLPMLNGYPIRLIVPGYYGTYWIKHLSEIRSSTSRSTGSGCARPTAFPTMPAPAWPRHHARADGTDRPPQCAFVHHQPGRRRERCRRTRTHRARDRLRRRLRRDGGRLFRGRRTHLERSAVGRGPGQLLVPRVACPVQARAAARTN